MSKTITCILPGKSSAEKAINEIKNEGISTENISVDPQSETHDVSSGQIYNVPLFFGANTDLSNSGVPYSESPGIGLIMGTAFRKSERNSKDRVYFSMPINDDTGGTVSYILRKNHAGDLKIIKS